MQILKLATALPEKECSTEKLLEAFPCQLPEGVRKNVLNLGVLKRYLIEDSDSETDLVNLCSEACQKVIQKAGVSIKKLGFLLQLMMQIPS